ncbi:hypothetical protein, partial [[Eubacterium] hominis]|uniref:hypothetical protein n=1 Tax=[Eubacterium] hominis TaxID=2764325 RepID=UPI0022E1A10E
MFPVTTPPLPLIPSLPVDTILKQLKPSSVTNVTVALLLFHKLKFADVIALFRNKFLPPIDKLLKSALVVYVLATA